MKLEHKTFPMEVKDVSENGEFSGYLSVFGNVDAYREIVMPGAFKDSLIEWGTKGRLPPILWQHNSADPIGPFTNLEEDEKGLHFEGRLLIDDVPEARKAHALAKNKVVSGMSIGFETIDYEWSDDDRIRRLKKIKLWEGSIVTFPANEAAQIETVKSIVRHGNLPDLKTFEKLLREAGFSKSQAKAIVCHGFAYLHRREAGGNDDEKAADLVAELRKLSILK